MFVVAVGNLWVAQGWETGAAILCTHFAVVVRVLQLAVCSAVVG